MRFLHDLIDDPDAPLEEHVRPRIAAGRTITAQAYLETLQQREA
jgi:aspartyl-tRNA(Asn)/glutamyl-tRNA(Gln) amidotransferase subunit A